MNKPWLIIAKHWKGQTRLLPTIIFAVLGISAAIWFIPVQPSFQSATVVVLLVCIVFIWQFVGAWRAITNSLTNLDGIGTSWLGYFSLMVATIVVIFQISDQVAGKFSISDYLRRTQRPPELKVNTEGTTVFIDGDIAFTTSMGLKNTLAKYPRIKTLELSSDGGLIYAARALANTIMEHKLDTRVVGHCYSACTLVFIAGEQRTISRQSQLGFHRYEFEIQNPLQTDSALDELSKDIVFFKARGVSETFLRQAFRTAHSSLWYPKNSGLFANGVTTIESLPVGAGGID